MRPATHGPCPSHVPPGSSKAPGAAQRPSNPNTRADRLCLVVALIVGCIVYIEVTRRGRPVARVKLLRVPNTRRVVLDEEAFQRFASATEPWLRPILLVAFDSGMRKSEVLNLRWSQLDLEAGAVRLEAEDTKTDEPRVVYLTERVLEVLAGLRRRGELAFPNPATGPRRSSSATTSSRSRTSKQRSPS